MVPLILVCLKNTCTTSKVCIWSERHYELYTAYYVLNKTFLYICLYFLRNLPGILTRKCTSLRFECDLGARNTINKYTILKRYLPPNVRNSTLSMISWKPHKKVTLCLTILYGPSMLSSTTLGSSIFSFSLKKFRTPCSHDAGPLGLRRLVSREI